MWPPTPKGVNPPKGVRPPPTPWDVRLVRLGGIITLGTEGGELHTNNTAPQANTRKGGAHPPVIEAQRTNRGDLHPHPHRILTAHAE